MSDFPALSLRGKTDSEKLAELISYLPSLTSSIEREMMSLDFSNLNEDLQKKISSGITEHQDLSGYASKNYTKKITNELESEIQSTQYGLTQLEGYVGDWSEFSNYTMTEEIRSLYNEIIVLKEKLSKLEG
jgi:hypothetical protein